MYAVVRRRRLGLALAVACLAATLAALVMADAGRPGLSRARARPTSAPSRARGPSPRSSCGGASASVRLRRPGGSPSGSGARSRPASSTWRRRPATRSPAPSRTPRSTWTNRAPLKVSTRFSSLTDKADLFIGRATIKGRRWAGGWITLADGRQRGARRDDSGRVFRGPKVTFGTTSVSVPGAGPSACRNTSMLGMPSGEHRGRGDVGPRDRGAAAARFRAHVGPSAFQGRRAAKRQG
jgi:hypothetical protein